MLNFYLYVCLLKQLFDHCKQQNLLFNIKKKKSIDILKKHTFLC